MKKVDFYYTKSYSAESGCIEVSINDIFLSRYLELNEKSNENLAGMLSTQFNGLFLSFEEIAEYLSKGGDCHIFNGRFFKEEHSYLEYLDTLSNKKLTKAHHEASLSFIKTVYVNSPDELEKEIIHLSKTIKQDYPELFL